MENNLKGLLIKHNVRLKKAYGQNFLTDNNLLGEIVDKAGITQSNEVLEIGCGAGALTSVLSSKAKKVIGYEIDLSLKPILNTTLKDCKNVEIIFSDIMKEKFEKVEKKFTNNYVMVANLPYYITTPIVTEFLEKSTKLDSMAIMVQEEVAERFCAKEGTAEYGAITVAINLRGSAEILKRVGREKFSPVPNVDSAVVKITIDRNKNKGVDFSAVREVVRCAFQSRRKMLVNNLINVFKLPREKVEEILIKSDIPITARGETLSAEQFIILSNNIKEYINGIQ